MSKSQAEQHKEKGNNDFKAGKYLSAIQHYTNAIDIVQDKAYYTNRAFCYLKIKQYKDCIRDCTYALQQDPKWAKAYARKAEALLRSSASAIMESSDIRVIRCLPSSLRMTTSNCWALAQPPASTAPSIPKPISGRIHVGMAKGGTVGTACFFQLTMVPS